MQKLVIFVLLSFFSFQTLAFKVPSISSISGDIWDRIQEQYKVPNRDDLLRDFGKESKKSLDPNDIKILVWNMYKGKNATWLRDFKTLSQDKDILLLQEMFLDKKMSQVFKEDVGTLYKTATSFIDLRKNARTGVANASTVKPLSTIPQPSRALEPAINTPKMTLFTSYPIEGSSKSLLVANIHAVNFVPVYSLSRQLKDAAEVIKNHDGPVIFGGDFNTWSTGKVSEMMRIMNELKLVEVSFSPDERKAVFNNIIDYVFVKGLEVLNSRTWGHLPGSDHTAMTVRLRYNVD